MNELQVTLALLQVVMLAVATASTLYLHIMKKELSTAVSACQGEKDKCVQVAKVLEASHNATSESIKRIDLRIEELNHRNLATQISRAIPGHR